MREGSERETDPLLRVVPIALVFGWNTSLLSIGQILVWAWSDGKLQRPCGISGIWWQSTHRATTLQLTIQIAVLQFCWHSMHSGYLVAWHASWNWIPHNLLQYISWPVERLSYLTFWIPHNLLHFCWHALLDQSRWKFWLTSCFVASPVKLCTSWHIKTG